ncbi:MAG TPA: glycine--tRNA ligase subunit beta [Desulfobacteraceae bacterium]|nr:glycine--tRNA ligase subunit beta [Desulfobacteraceae bacterium]
MMGEIMVSELLFEIGTEEIPSGYLDRGLSDLKDLSVSCLAENRIEYAGGVFTYGTPRRLVLIVKAVADAQQDTTEEVTGPPARVAFDEQGNPTKAALGFAERQGVSVESLERVETPKGEYLFLKRTIPGRRTIDVLAEALPGLISAIPWPKSMRWGTVSMSFVRPIHWITALLGGEVIPFEAAGIKSGTYTFGHRFMAPERTEVRSVEDYMNAMERGYVVVDPAERRRLIKDMVERAASGVDGTPADDPDLLSTVANLVEYPSAVCGSFDERFLSLPETVLVTAMKEHQKYFSVHDASGRLLPNFVAVNNTVARDEAVVRKGHERVLRARLADAVFFFEEDRKKPLADRFEDLEGVIFQAELGTSRAKVTRFSELAVSLSRRVAPDSATQVEMAAKLCKCDLVTQMVGEFPSLQGVMGASYARMEGYEEEICRAIHEHYLPARAGEQVPASDVAAVVGVADRVDSIVGYFAVGLEPSGNADPFALRRHALAVLRILEQKRWDVSLRWLVNEAACILAGSGAVAVPGDTVERVLQFCRERYRRLLLREGYDADCVESVLSVDFEWVSILRTRIEQVGRFSRESEKFGALCLTFKRVRNILKKETMRHPVAPGLFQDQFETSLWEAASKVEKGISVPLREGDYYTAAVGLTELGKPVDDLFDEVEIMTGDEALRNNRLGMLQRLEELILRVADFSKFPV